MTDVAISAPAGDRQATRSTDWQSPAMRRRIARRYASERRFKALGLGAVIVSSLFLAFLLVTMMGNGFNGFRQTSIAVPVDFPALTGNARAASLEGENSRQAVSALDPTALAQTAIEVAYGNEAQAWFSPNSWTDLRDALLADPSLVERNDMVWMTAASAIDGAVKGDADPAAERVLERLEAEGRVRTGFNWAFLTNSDGTDSSQVGIWGALKGSLLTMVVTLLLAFPVAVLAAIYLEEYAPKNRLTDFIEVTINNLAAVPSIIFGLLGLVVFLEWFALPRSAALVGGLTLALMTMPVIVIAGRNAIKAVPPSIREAALGVGASPVQVVFHHVLPLAIPGIMTGTIIGMARALGETAPLLMIGMRAFTAAPPQGFTDPATVLPVQIFLWSDEVNRGFVEKTSAAIIVLLVVLLSMNAVAIYLRNRFETRW